MPAREMDWSERRAADVLQRLKEAADDDARLEILARSFCTLAGQLRAAKLDRLLGSPRSPVTG